MRDTRPTSQNSPKLNQTETDKDSDSARFGCFPFSEAPAEGHPSRCCDVVVFCSLRHEAWQEKSQEESGRNTKGGMHPSA